MMSVSWSETPSFLKATHSASCGIEIRTTFNVATWFIPRVFIHGELAGLLGSETNTAILVLWYLERTIITGQRGLCGDCMPGSGLSPGN